VARRQGVRGMQERRAAAAGCGQARKDRHAE
jgi:hypothetical protein